MVTYKKLGLSILLPFFNLMISEMSWASVTGTHPLYVGVLSGMGSTTWKGLVPSNRNQNGAMNVSTPIRVSEGGGVWGGVLGYDFSPYFALEANYFHYPQAQVTFDKWSLYSFHNHGNIALKTKTEAYNLMAKVMLIIPNTRLRVYSSAGVGQVHRLDMVIDDWRLSPSFGFGLNHQLAEHFMGELGMNYTAGYGESQLNPADTYFPFLYSVTMRLAYCF